MNQTYPTIKTNFSFSVLQGSAYEAGVSQATVIKEIPGFKEFLNSGSNIPHRPPFDETLSLIRQFCPGLEEEINGFCDVLKIPPQNLYYLASTHLSNVHCSQMVILPALSDNQHTLVGRNYDFGETMDDKRLCSTFIQGKNAHIGFSTLFFGRQEGMNEHGLTITATVGGMPVGVVNGLKSPIQPGLQFWAVIRTLLEQCSSVNEALNLLRQIPNCGNPIYIITDPSGTAARVEVYGGQQYTTLIDSNSQTQYLLATNHFLSDSIRQLEPMRQTHSINRYKAADSFISNKKPHIKVNDLKTILSTPYPTGLNCHFFPEFFGTLHAMVFDLNDRTIELTLGTPSTNPWQHVNFNTRNLEVYESILPVEKTPPDFWLPGQQ